MKTQSIGSRELEQNWVDVSIIKTRMQLCKYGLLWVQRAHTILKCV